MEKMYMELLKEKHNGWLVVQCRKEELQTFLIFTDTGVLENQHSGEKANYTVISKFNDLEARKVIGLHLYLYELKVVYEKLQDGRKDRLGKIIEELESK